MTKWQTRREMVSPPLTMWRMFREVDGVEEVDIRIYGTWDEAIVVARKMNEMEEAGK